MVNIIGTLRSRTGARTTADRKWVFPKNACALETFSVYMDCVTPSCIVDDGKNTILAL